MKRSNRCGIALSGMPTPVSLTEMATASPRSTTSTAMAPPSGVNLKALDRRFITIFSNGSAARNSSARSSSLEKETRIRRASAADCRVPR